MSKLRSLSTSFWSDPFIEDLTPNQKLLFIYLITNEKTNMLGIYESSIRKISFETGIKRDEVEKGLKAFESVGKVKYINNYVILVNYLKHQNFNTNMKKSAIDVYNNLPDCLKVNNLKLDKSNPLESFETLSNHLGMVRKIEDEREVESELEDEVKKEEEQALKMPKIDFNIFWNLYDKKLGKDKCVKKWNNLSLEDQQKIIDYIPKYKKSQPDKQFRKNPETFFNNKSWEDEIILNQTQQINTNEIKTRIGYDSDKF